MIKKRSVIRRDKFPSRRLVGAPDKTLALVILSLVAFGVLMVYNSSIIDAYYQGFQDKYHFLKLQVLWALTGISLGSLAIFIDYHRLKRLAAFFLLITLILQVIALLPGVGVEAHGAQRWLKLGPIQLQPSELAKLSFVIYLAAWFSTRPSLGGFLFLSAVLSGLVLLGRDLGTAVIIFLTGLSLYFISGAPLYHFLVIVPVAGVAVGWAIFTAPYRLNRVLALLNPLRDPLGSSYHIIQILLALGSGGLFGLGLGQSRQKYRFLPAASTDSIFAIIGEELGFLGGVSLILVYLFLIWKGIKTAQHQPENFGRLLAYGITFWLGIQTFVNLGAMVAIFPLTGVPLPFISYGGSSLIVSLIGVGLLLNLSRHR